MNRFTQFLSAVNRRPALQANRSLIRIDQVKANKTDAFRVVRSRVGSVPGLPRLTCTIPYICIQARIVRIGRMKYKIRYGIQEFRSVRHRSFITEYTIVQGFQYSSGLGPCSCMRLTLISALILQLRPSKRRGSTEEDQDARKRSNPEPTVFCIQYF